VPGGGRSTPIVMGNRVYVQQPVGRGPQLQERVLALDADTGKTVWEYRFNLFQSDVPAHRIAWASPAADPETGNIYALSGGAQVLALSPKASCSGTDRSVRSMPPLRHMVAGRCRRWSMAIW
jgi:outer membrane protein assembly factor BamB